VTRENQTSNQSATETPATVEQNIPDQGPGAGGAAGPQSSELAERKEEQTNYEINSKVVSTVRNSYMVEGLSIAVVVNRARMIEMLGEAPTEEQTAAYLAELQQVVNTAAGVDDARGDRANITVMDFLSSELLSADAAQGGFADTLKTHIGTLINAIAFITVAVLLIMFGFRRCSVPAARARGRGSPRTAQSTMMAWNCRTSPPPLWAAPGAMPMEGFGADFGFGEDDGSELEMEESGSFNRRVKEGPERRLARMVEINEERAAKILRQWASGEAA
jgi:flagellar M-ring protein FliF